MLVIDNYDSFVYNLVQYLGELGAEPIVHRHDAITLDEMRALEPDAVLISPGPGRPADAGLSNEAIRAFGETGTPVLGVCLGLQCIGELYGGSVVRAPRVMHGKTSEIRHTGVGRVRGPARARSPRPATTRSSSRATRCPTVLEITAESEDGLVMGLRHREFPIEGVQFHPESILTTAGTGSWRTSSPAGGRGRCARATRDLGETVVEQRREHFAVEFGPRRPAPRAAAPSRSPRRWRNDPAYARLTMLGLVGVRSRVSRTPPRSGSVARRVRARCTPSRRGPSTRAAGRAAAVRRAISRTHASASASVRPCAAHAFAHAPDVDLDADPVVVVDLRGDRGGGVAADAGELGQVVGPAVVASMRTAASQSQRARRG